MRYEKGYEASEEEIVILITIITITIINIQRDMRLASDEEK